MNDFEYACIKCFKDKVLLKEILSFNQKGDCSWCGSQDINIIPLYKLGELFRGVCSLYKQVDGGLDNISYLILEDWDLYGEKIENDPVLMQDLTVSILESGIAHKDLFTDHPDYNEGFERTESLLLDYWDEIAIAHLTGKKLGEDSDSDKKDMYSNLADILGIVFEDLAVSYKQGHIFYRARIHDDRYRTNKFSTSDLGAPPRKEAIAGRANRKNEPVLYLANNEKTAIYEIRAWKGTAVAYANIKIKKDVSVVSLLNYDFPESPFYQDYLSWRVELAGLFYRFAGELSMPVMDKEKDQLYQSTQLLCDLIKKAGYNGVEYPSSSDFGHNIVLFNPELAEPISVTYVKIDDINPAYHILNEHEAIYDEGPYDYLFGDSKVDLE